MAQRRRSSAAARHADRFDSAAETAAAEKAHSDAEASRPEYLILVRESSPGIPALWKMYQQTAQQHLGVPGVREALEAGMEPYSRPEDFGGRRVGKGETRGALFRFSGTWFLLFEGSAASEDPTESRRTTIAENVFVEVLKEILIELRPRKLVAATFSRLARSQAFAQDLLREVIRHVDIVIAGDIPDIEPATDQGNTVWTIAAWFAETERKSEIRRMLTGKLIGASEGRWMRGIDTLPFGYRMRPDRIVEPDESLRPAVEKMIAILGEPHLTAEEAVLQMADAGVTSNRLMVRSGTDGSVADILNPGSFLMHLGLRFPLYRTGLHVVRVGNPLPGTKSYGPFQVQPERKGPGYLEVVYDFGLPPGGWATDEALDAAEENLRSCHRVIFRRGLKPLVNLVRYTEEGNEIRLRTDNDHYILRSRPDDGSAEVGPGIRAPSGRAWNGLPGRKADGIRLATIAPADLHQSIAHSVMELLRDGILARRIDALTQVRGMSGTRIVDARANRLATLDRMIVEANSRVQAAVRLARLAVKLASEDADLSPELLEDAQAAKREVARLEREREDLRSRSYAPVDFGVGFEAEAAFLARALANLACAHQVGGPGLAQELIEILRDFRMDADGYEVRWSCVVLIPADGAHLQIRAQGTVPNRLRDIGAVGVDRLGSMLEHFMWDGLTMAEVARSDSRKPGRSVYPLMRKHLVEMGLAPDAARLLTIVEVAEVRRVVWAHLNGRDPLAGVDPAWADHIARVYLDPGFKWSAPTWNNGVAGRQAALDLLVRLGGQASLDVLVTEPQFLGARKFSMPSSVTWGPEQPASLRRTGDWRRSARGVRGLALIDCPHENCGGRCTLALWLPETAFGLKAAVNVICPQCRRLPVEGSPQFPESYLNLRRTRDSRAADSTGLLAAEPEATDEQPP